MRNAHYDLMDFLDFVLAMDGDKLIKNSDD